MKYLLEFLRQKAPEPGSEIPAYFRKALVTSEWILAAYFAVSEFLFAWAVRRWSFVPMLLLAGAVLCVLNVNRMSTRVNLGCYALITVIWCSWFVHCFGWGCGTQHLLVPILVLTFFDIFEPPWLKITYFVALIVFRMLLFAHSLNLEPTIPLGDVPSIVIQTVNSLTLFIVMANNCILFSSNTQKTERQLRIDNQELHREAGTDPLTQLPNRRALLDAMELFRAENPEAPFSVAIADIDFFKKINDTYGHPCGDYTLQRLADLFRETAGEQFSLCRWGGEEFCFFLPQKNLDDAGAEMNALNVAVRRMPLSFEGNDFHITITIGVEENDFVSSLDDILQRADRKLYMGKETGRDRVVI